MKSPAQLEKQLTVLVSGFGYDAVRQTLSGLRRPERCAPKSQKPAAKPKAAPKLRAKPDAVAVVAAMDLGDSAKKQFLADLAKKYEAKEFMPDVVHARAFLENKDPLLCVSGKNSPIKSRQQATAKVFKKMAAMDLEKLRDIVHRGAYDPPKRLADYARTIENYGRQMRAERYSRD